MMKLPMYDTDTDKLKIASPRILFVDDHSVVRHGVSVLLNGALGQHIIKCEASSGQEAIEILEGQEFDLIIVDISMPGMNGLELLAHIKSKHLSGAPVLVYSMYTEEQFAVQAFSLGAAGYIAKHAPSQELVAAVKKILSGGRYVSDALSQLLIDHIAGGAGSTPAQPQPQAVEPVLSVSSAKGAKNNAIEKLSKKELEVILLFAQGLSPKEIGEYLNRSEKTVSAHKLSAMNKLGVDDFSEALDIVKQAKREGLI